MSVLSVGIPKETTRNETRVAATPDAVKKWLKKGLKVVVERSAGAAAKFSDDDFQKAGAELGDAKAAFSADIVLKIHAPTAAEISQMKKGTLLASMIEPFQAQALIDSLAQAGIDCLGLELIPRTSRAQSMDVLSSQANIAGYRAVLEATQHFGRFFSMMMTSAGMSKPAKVVVLGAGVAGLQAIATAKRLGAAVEAFDVRAEVKEQILSLGAKFIEIDLGEEGSGAGGYAKELSEAAKKKQQDALTQKLKTADIIVSTANIPGRKAPVLITEEAVRGMRTGSVIVDMAAANGGNCPLTEAGKATEKHGVILVGHTNFPALMPTDSSQFYANNLINLLTLILEQKDGATTVKMNLEDDIIAATLVTHNGTVRYQKK